MSDGSQENDCVRRAGLQLLTAFMQGEQVERRWRRSFEKKESGWRLEVVGMKKGCVLLLSGPAHAGR